MNDTAIKFYENLKMAGNPKEVKLCGKTSEDFAIEKDIALIQNYSSAEKDLLDIGTGTGLIVNPLIQSFRTITCIEYFEKFSKYIEKQDNVEIIQSDIRNITVQNIYHIITGFGIFHYFSNDEIRSIYPKLFNLLHNDGILIIKNQFSLQKDDVIIDKYSEELQRHYYSCYRTLENEKKILKTAGFTSEPNIIDIYPTEYNRWDNTHFYAVIIQK